MLDANTLGGDSTDDTDHIDNTKSHARAFEMLVEAGIYVLAVNLSMTFLCPTTNVDIQPLSTPRHYINRADPHRSYNAVTVSKYFHTIDIMASCPNTLGVLVADGLVTDDKSVACVPIVSAVVRDVKEYMKLKNERHGQRILPVGYGAAMNQNGERDVAISHYLSSGDQTQRIDFYTVGAYTACSNLSSHQSSANTTSRAEIRS